MKALSFVKQAMTVALLLSVVPAFPMMDKLKSAVAVGTAYLGKPAVKAGALIGKLPYGPKIEEVLKPAKDTADKFVATDNTVYATEKDLLDAKKTLKMIPAVKGFKRTIGNLVNHHWNGSKAAEFMTGHPNVQAAGLASITVAMAAVVIYGGYKAYKAFFGKDEESDQDEQQEEAQPQVTAQEEVEVQTHVPSKVSKIEHRNPVA